MLETILIILVAYLLGSIPFGLILAKLSGKTDPRHSGSGNIGATNMWRLNGKKLGALTLIFDILKGLAAVLLFQYLVPFDQFRAGYILEIQSVTTYADDTKQLISPAMEGSIQTSYQLYLAVIGLAAFLGHLYPIWLKFKGGKGIATGIGVFFAWNLLAGLLVTTTFFLLLKWKRYVSLAAMLSFILAPLYFWLVTAHIYYSVAALVMAALTIIRHYTNITRLKAGTEGKV